MSRRRIRNRRLEAPGDIEFQRRLRAVRDFVTRVGPGACADLVARGCALCVRPIGREGSTIDVCELDDTTRHKLQPPPPSDALVVAVPVLAAHRIRFVFIRPPFEVT